MSIKKKPKDINALPIPCNATSKPDAYICIYRRSLDELRDRGTSLQLYNKETEKSDWKQKINKETKANKQSAIRGSSG